MKKGFKMPGAKSPLFDEPWRKTPWADKEKDYYYVRNYKPHSEAQFVRILLIGPPGSGKSSFINSVDTALRGQISARALADTGFDHSFTKEYRTFKIQRETPGSHYNFVFSDTMGIEKDTGRGIDVETMKLIMEGHLKEGSKLDVRITPTQPGYNQTPTINDKVHVLVCVVDADNMAIMDDVVVSKIKYVREEARALGIPQIAVLTKIDDACPKVKKTIKKVYRSKVLKKRMEEVSANLGIPMNCIFLVQNYSEEADINNDIDTLLLNTMKTIIRFGEDFLNDRPTEYTEQPQQPGPYPRKCD